MVRDIALERQGVREVTAPTIVGAETVAISESRHVDRPSIQELETELALELMGNCPCPSLEELEIRLIEFVEDAPELHAGAPSG